MTTPTPETQSTAETPRLPDPKTMYRAVLEKDSRFEGVFVVAVKTTGIFCRPTCTARNPKAENVEFYPNSKTALSFGFRPCKICKPMTALGDTPAWLKELLTEIAENPGIKIQDQELRNRNIDPARIRRWFKKHHGVTFQAYLRALRINNAFGLIKHKGSVTESAFDSGFNSLSGFHDAFKKATGFTPSASKHENIITITRLVTPIGPMFAGATDEGICLLEFTDRRMLETQCIRLEKLFKAKILPGDNPWFGILNQQLQEYFAAKRKQFELPLVTPGTDFQQQVWQETANYSLWQNTFIPTTSCRNW